MRVQERVGGFLDPRSCVWRVGRGGHSRVRVGLWLIAMFSETGEEQLDSNAVANHSSGRSDLGGDVREDEPWHVCTACPYGSKGVRDKS